jgi:peptidoglycan/LPS O-acetylase OafA/YrhL
MTANGSKPWLTRTIFLVLVAMVMFAAGLFVFISANDREERILGGIAVLGSVAVVVANVVGNGKGNGSS